MEMEKVTERTQFYINLLKNSKEWEKVKEASWLKFKPTAEIMVELTYDLLGSDPNEFDSDQEWVEEICCKAKDYQGAWSDIESIGRHFLTEENIRDELYNYNMDDFFDFKGWSEEGYSAYEGSFWGRWTVIRHKGYYYAFE